MPTETTPQCVTVRRLSQLAHSLNDLFHSRTNDADGYWALGVMRRLAEQHATTTIAMVFNAQRCSMLPDILELQPLLAIWQQRIQHKLTEFDIEPTLLKSVTIEAQFNASMSHTFTVGLTQKVQQQMAAQPSALACVTRCTVTNVFGGARSAVHFGYCWPHDPNKETRSTRRYNYQ